MEQEQSFLFWKFIQKRIIGFFIWESLGQDKCCYARIGCGGKCYESFDVLTGVYSKIIKIRDIKGDKNEILWNKLKDAKDKEYEICAGTRLGSIKMLD